ncbi:MAG: lyase family protein, partial [Oscillospiraceae bacterium]
MSLWGARFKKPTEDIVKEFNSSIKTDNRMYKNDLLGSIAHTKMLSKQNIIPKNAADNIINELENILDDIVKGKLSIDTNAEDIHMFIETVLTERIGEQGKHLHTARSRNDQVALDIRLYLIDEICEIKNLLSNLIDILCEISKKHTKTIMCGYTHL